MRSDIQQAHDLVTGDSAVVMGILNVTPDSFSDGGRYDTVEPALLHARAMLEQGAHIIDVGGESTRPGAAPVSATEECDRVLPVIEAIRQYSDIPVSIDTSKAEVMRQAIAAGASMVNDVNALRAEGAEQACAEAGVPVCLMHMQGQPRTMQQDPQYTDVVAEVTEFLRSRANSCGQSGIPRDAIVLDPGFGFGKTLAHNLSLLTGLHRLCALNYPVLAGLSRKSMLAALMDRPGAEDPANRVDASVTAAIIARQEGASWFRVHDVRETVDALRVLHNIAAMTD